MDDIERIADEVWGADDDWSAQPDPGAMPEPAGAAVYHGEDRDVTDGTSHVSLGADMGALPEAQDALPEAGPDFSDSGQNSFEQDVAVKTWVDHAVDMLNRDKGDDEVLASLAHDGCPDPQAVLERAKAQPPVEQEPDMQDGGAMPPTPPVYDEHGDSGMAEPVVSSTRHISEIGRPLAQRVEVGGRPGSALGRYTGLWGDLVRVAFDDGSHADVPEEAVQAVADQVSHPVDSIRDFISQFPAVDSDSASSVSAAYKAVREARAMARAAAAGGSDEAVALDQVLARDQEALMERLHVLAQDAADAHSATPAMGEVVHQASVGGYGRSFVEDAAQAVVADAAALDLGRAREDVAIALHEASFAGLEAGIAVEDALDGLAQRVAHLPDAEREAALEAARVAAEDIAARRIAAWKHPEPEAAPELDGFDGPAEELFA